MSCQRRRYGLLFFTVVVIVVALLDARVETAHYSGRICGLEQAAGRSSVSCLNSA